MSTATELIPENPIITTNDLLGFDPEDVKILDPLYANPLYSNSKLSECNDQRDVIGIIEILKALLPAKSIAETYSKNETIAAVTTLGPILGSLAKLGIDPFEAVPEVEDILEILEINQDGWSPYHTGLHILANTTGPNSRRFTDMTQERDLMDISRESIKQMMMTNVALLNKDTMAAIKHFEPVVSSIPKTVEKVGGVFFNEHVRDWFKPIMFKGRKLEAQGGKQFPICLMDQIIWGDVKNDHYQKYLREIVPFMPAPFQKYMRSYFDKPSYVTQIINKLDKNLQLDQILELLDIVLKFRAPHFGKLAFVSFTNENKERVGSGGYNANHLLEIIYMMKEQKTKLLV